MDQQFCQVISLTDLGRFTRRYEWRGNGAPPCPRVWLAHAFIAKHVYQFSTTSALLDAPKLVGHVSRDATAIEAPERPAPKAAPAAPAAPRQRGRPRRGEVRPPAPPKRLELQPGRRGRDTVPRLDGVRPQRLLLPQLRHGFLHLAEMNVR